LGFSKTVATRYLAPEVTPTRRSKVGRAGQPGRPSSRLLKRTDAGDDDRVPQIASRGSSRRTAAPPIASLVREWLAELKVMGRSEQTIKWYRQKMEFYLEHEGGPATLDGLTSGEVKRLLGNLIDRRLAPKTIHGFFEVVRAFANWALREGFPVDPAMVRMRPPKGKGAKFRRVPVSVRLRREIDRYVNRYRGEAETKRLRRRFSQLNDLLLGRIRIGDEHGVHLVLERDLPNIVCVAEQRGTEWCRLIAAHYWTYDSVAAIGKHADAVNQQFRRPAVTDHKCPKCADALSQLHPLMAPDYIPAEAYQEACRDQPQAKSQPRVVEQLVSVQARRC
jgi:hypothetical protein